MARSRRNYTVADRALLWSRSGGMCCFPGCDVVCVEEAQNEDASATIGQFGHIEGSSDEGPRPNPSLSERERDQYTNLILLCPNHHRLVDVFDSTYTVEELRRWKGDRESRLREFLTQEMGQVSFTELDVITKALVSNTPDPPTSISLIPPQDKLERNGLTAQTGYWVTAGIVLSKQVSDFVKRMSLIDETFIGRLTNGFIDEYQRQRQAGLEGDALFEAMRLFSFQGLYGYQYQSAGLAVLVYLFEICDVFEH